MKMVGRAVIKYKMGKRQSNKLSDRGYSSTVTFPSKMFYTNILDNKGRIIPRHLTVIPTNACNLECPFCSWAKRDKTKSIDFQQLKNIIMEAKILGTKAITFTGGGEPLLYPYIDELFQFTYQQGIKIGLITNGTLLGKIPKSTIEKLEWCRISISDGRDMLPESTIKIIQETDITWGYNYVLTGNINVDFLSMLLKQAEQLKVKYFRITDDQYAGSLELPNIILPDFAYYFKRNRLFQHGGNCYVGLLKPVINVDGYIYPCCHRGEERKLPQTSILADNLRTLYEKQPVFDGSKCTICPFMSFNDILSRIRYVEHQEFI